jgi:2-polyprenyl-3-methyl-5-hydroxy-6-metoxy-1,4-benzoquinol methylase
VIKKIIKKFINKLGYDISKTYDSGHEGGAVNFNSVELVNQRNTDLTVFHNNMKYDAKLINALYLVIKNYFNTEKFSYLDVGCGTGVLVNLIKKDFLEADVRGCDLSSVKVDNCNKFYNYEGLFFIHNILESINNKYNFISCTEVLEHLEYPEIALKNLIDGLGGKGILFITVPNGRLDRYVGHIHFWSPESFKIFITNNLKDTYGNFKVDFDMVGGKNLAIIQNV